MGADRTSRAVEGFFSLLRSGLYSKPIEGDFALSSAEWAAMLELSEHQSVIGMVSKGVSLLPVSVSVPDAVLFPLMAKADKIRRRNAEVNSALESLLEFFTEAGIEAVPMKGPSVGKYYPEPMLRQSGDLDIYIPQKDWRAVLKALETKKILYSPTPDGSIHYYWGGVDIDQHRQYFDLSRSEVSLPEVPSAYAELLMLSLHILKHCCSAGIGLRQLCDMAMAYRALEYDKDVLLGYFESTGTVKWNKLLCNFLYDYLGAENLPYANDGKGAEPLLKIVMEGGNFGFYASGRGDKLQSSAFKRKMDTAFRMLKRMPFALKYAGKEALGEFFSLVKGNIH